MFTALAARLRADLDGVKTVVQWQDALRSTVHAAAALGTVPLMLDANSLTELRSRAPAKLEWQVFDHCAAVSRIYALFEKAICDLVAEFLSFLPKVSPGYEDLHERLRQQHRSGVGQILHKWSLSHPIYGKLAERDIAAGLADGLRGKSYALLCDAFLVDPENFRASALGRLFGGLGFDDAFAWIRNSDAVHDFCSINLAGTETADSFLDSLVRIRNEAAHGSASNLASANEIVNYAEFLALISEALAALLRTYLVRQGETKKCSLLLGEILHVWSDNVVGVRSTSQVEIKLGDRLYAGKKQIDPVEVISLRIGKTDHAAIQLVPPLEFGIKLDRKIPVAARIFRWTV